LGARRRTVNTNPHKWRRPALVLLSVLALVVVFLVVFMRQEPNRAISETSDPTYRFPAQTSDDPIPQPVPAAPIKDQPATPRSPAADAPTASSAEAKGGDPQYLTPLRTPSPDAVYVSGTGSRVLGVVDLERLFAACQSGADSQDARARMLPEIRRIVAVRAKAHGLALVLDISARTAHETPFVLATNGVPDLTDEVLRELSP
jgi:hypothetical protein